MQYAPLHRLQAVLYVGHGALKYNVRGVVEKPVLVHSAKVMHHRSVKPVDRLVHLAAGLHHAIFGLFHVSGLLLEDDVVVYEENAAGRH